MERPTAKNPNTTKKFSTKSRILLVEDHRIAEKVTKNMLASLHCDVDIAMDGKTVLELIKQQPYDLILMDVGLPDMNGDEITRRIRAYELTKGLHLPIVALTAHQDIKTQQSCLNAGMNAVLNKPLCLEEAEKVLNDFIPARKKWLKDSQPLIPSEEKRFNFDYAKRLLGDNETAIWETLIQFVESLSSEAKKLAAAYQQENWLTIQAIANKLKGGSSYCGTLRLKSICSELENIIEAGLISRAEDFYRKLLDEISALQKLIKEQNPLISTIQ